jgi:hypothetical protein
MDLMDALEGRNEPYGRPWENRDPKFQIEILILPRQVAYLIRVMTGLGVVQKWRWRGNLRFYNLES